MSEDKRDYEKDLAATPGEIKFAERAIMAERENKRLQQEVNEFLRLNRKYQAENARLREKYDKAVMERYEETKKAARFQVEKKDLEAENTDLRTRIAESGTQVTALRKAAIFTVQYFEGPSEDWGGSQRWETERNNGGKKAYKALKQALSTPAPVNLEAMRRVCEAAARCRKACKRIDEDIKAGVFVYAGENTPVDISNNAVKEMDEALADLEGGGAGA